MVELFRRCSSDVAWERYRRRAGSRDPGHFDHARTRDELWNDEVAEPAAGPWPLLEVDTNRPVDVADVVAWVEDQLPRSETGSSRSG